MLSPKRLKYRKHQRNVKNSLLGRAQRGNSIAFGDYGLISLGNKWLTGRQIEAARIAMTRHIKRGGKVWIRIFPDIPYTRKPAETRMGSGKGNLESWVAVVKKGTVMFEIAGVDRELARGAMLRGASKLPIRCKFSVRDDVRE
ncbi:MAG: 50S ribosomal protein L16 [Salinispira sp.]